MELVFEGTTAIAADRPRVFARLMDPNAVAACVPAVQSVEAVDPSHFKVLSALGIGSIRVRFTLDIQITETSPPAHASMTVRGKAPGSAVDMTSSVELTEAGAATRLAWRMDAHVNGQLASLGARLLQGTALRLAQEFWDEFGRQTALALEAPAAPESPLPEPPAPWPPPAPSPPPQPPPAPPPPAPGSPPPSETESGSPPLEAPMAPPPIPPVPHPDPDDAPPRGN